MNLIDRFSALQQSHKGGALVFLLALLATVVWIQVPTVATGKSKVTRAGKQTRKAIHPTTNVQFSATLSHPMIIQNQNGEIYVDFSIDTPSLIHLEGVVRQPTDMVIVLDRSGSMNEPRKWPYAIRAVEGLIQRLNAEDRIALITFDTYAQINADLQWANPRNKARLRRTVRNLRPGNATNMGDALHLAANYVHRNKTDRRTRVLLLSDGQANTGIVHPVQLGQKVRTISERGGIVSTIGMGLGFNESLMAQLADHGMGTFNYLENLGSLETILAQELSDSRDVYAEGSTITITLPSGMKVIEASGYPFQQRGRRIEIQTGQLLQNRNKNFMVTLRVPNRRVKEYSVGPVELSYQQSGKTYRQKIAGEPMTVACVEPSRKKEVLSSVNEEVYRKAWLKNNYGSVLRSVSESLSKGDRRRADKTIAEFESKLGLADEMAEGAGAALAPQVQALKEQVDDSFQGPDAPVKQNRKAKAFYKASQSAQRGVTKKGEK